MNTSPAYYIWLAVAFLVTITMIILDMGINWLFTNATFVNMILFIIRK
mgnify:CR=1 FL=1